MTKLSKREKYLVIVALVFASMALFVYFYYFPLKNDIKDLEHESEKVSLEIDEKKSLAIKIENTKKEIENMKKEFSEKKAFLMPTIDEAEVLDYISNITNYGSGTSQIANMTAVSYDDVVVANEELYYSKDITLNFHSSYDDLKNILMAFEVGEKFVVFPTITINKKDEATVELPTAVITNEYPLSISCQLRFYGEESRWDGSGEYTFMEGGNFSKTNLFE